MNHVYEGPSWGGPPTPPLSPSDVEKPRPAAPAGAAPCGRSPAATMRELATLAAVGKVPSQAGEAARLGQCLLLSAAPLLALEGAHAALSSEFDAKMDAWESAIYVSPSEEVAAARAAALQTLEPLREAVAAVDAARGAWAALDALRGGSPAQAQAFAAEFEQAAAPGGGVGVAGVGGEPGSAHQTPSPFIDSLTKYLIYLSSSSQKHTPPPPHFSTFQHTAPPPSLLGGPQPAPVLVRRGPPTSPPVFGGVPLAEPRASPPPPPPRRATSLPLHSLGAEELSMMTPIAASAGAGLADGMDWSTVLAVAATGAGAGAPGWAPGPAHSGLEAAEDPMFGLSPFLKQQLDAMFAAQQHSSGGDSAGGGEAGGGHGGNRGAEVKELEYADVLCAMGRDREDAGAGTLPRRGAAQRVSSTAPATNSELATPGASSLDATGAWKKGEPNSRRARLAAAVAAFMASPAAAAPLPSAYARGVTCHKRTMKYEAHIWTPGQQYYLGTYLLQEAGARGHDIAALATPGARLNYPAADYVDLLPLVERLSTKEVAVVLKEVARDRAASGRASTASGLGGVAGGGKRRRDGGSIGVQVDASTTMKRKGTSERAPMA